MDLFPSIQISASALEAQKLRLNTISSNIANIETTRTPEGGPYKRKTVVFQAAPVGGEFEKHLSRSLQGSAQGVTVQAIVTDPSPPQLAYNPSHPDADEAGYVSLPNVNLQREVADMTDATRAYESNVTVIKAAKRMALKTLEIGK